MRDSRVVTVSALIATALLLPAPLVLAQAASIGAGYSTGGQLEAELRSRSSVASASREFVLSANFSQVIWIAQPVWSAGEPGVNVGLCRGWRYVAATTPEEAERLREEGREAFLDMYDLIIVREFPDVDVDVDCPGDVAAAVPAVVLRDAVRASVVGQLPRPEPRVPPGFALAGLEMYLDSGPSHGLSFEQTDRITVGPFSFDVDIEATGQTTVDWGDGTPPITYDVPGGPYPDGQIRHTYRDASTVTVTVTDTWVIDFQATTAGGAVLTDSVVAELDEVVIEDFEVREFRAVRVGP